MSADRTTYLFAILLSFLPLAGHADPPATGDGVTSFPAAYYADGEPVSALDIANRTPGFALDRGNTQVRGLEGTVGNVLIDGRWPTTKALSLAEVLASIPYSAIERTEVVRAGASGFDLMGRQVVLNIVRRTDNTSILTTEAALRFYSDNDRDTGGSARVEYSRSSGKVSFDAGLVFKTEQNAFSAGEGAYTRTDAAGNEVLSGWFDNDDWRESLQATVNGNYASDNFDMALNLAVTESTTFIDQVGDYQTSIGEPFDEVVDIERVSEVFEVGVDVNSQLAADRRLNLKLLHRSESQDGDASLSIQDMQVLADDVFDWSETAMRAMVRQNLSSKLSIEIGAEAAFNELDSFVEVDVGGVPLDLPNADIKVEEDRYQAFAKTIIQASSSLLIEAGLDYERSTLKQSGDANLTKSFDFVKPRLAATWSINETTDLRLRLQNVVGQLSFNSFAASPSLESGIISAGNADLEPEESDEYELQLERRFWGDGSAMVTYTHARLKNALDYIPVGTNFDALGNAGKATKNTWVFNLNLPFDRMGWNGATFRTEIKHSDSEIVDPFTAAIRPISGRDAWIGLLGFTWELPDYNSVIGFDGFWGFYERAYRITEERLEREYPAPLSFWWDRTYGDGLILRVEIANLSPPRRVRQRDIYEDSRADGVMTALERRKNEQAPHLMLKLRKRF